MKIKLTQGFETVIDDSDYDKVSAYHWHYDHGYARAQKLTDTRHKVYLHKIILEVPQGYVLDHINGDKLDNRKTNLRVVTQYQNTLNHSLNKNNVSGFKGVGWHKGSGKWRAYISPKNKMIHLGLFKTKEEAVKAYNEASRIHFGEYGKLNIL